MKREHFCPFMGKVPDWRRICYVQADGAVRPQDGYSREEGTGGAGTSLKNA